MPRKKQTKQTKASAEEQRLLLDIAIKSGELKESRIFGPPGTGKTSYLSGIPGQPGQIELAARKYGGENVVVASFTTAASAELVQRHLPVPRDKVATLHAHFYRALGSPPIVEDGAKLKEFNDYVARIDPDFMISEADIDPDDPYTERMQRTEGDRLLSLYNTKRAQMRDWRTNEEVAMFVRHWENFKSETGTIDFTDIITLAIENLTEFPGNPSVGFFDEAQDFTLLELTSIRKLGRKMKHIVLAGDDDQCIYAFKGATPDAFLDPPIPDEHKKVLPQSWRVPKTVYDVATRLVHRLTRREEKAYFPRQSVEINNGVKRYIKGTVEQGEVRRDDFRFANIDSVEEMVYDAQRYTERGKSVMFLASCSYQLNTLKGVLRDNGLLYHNPYRKKRGDWNPLGQGKSASRILAYLAPRLRNNLAVPDTAEGNRKLSALARTVKDNDRFWHAHLWTKRELTLWTEQLKTSGFLKRGAMQRLEMNESDDGQLTALALAEYFKDTEELVFSAHGFLSWFKRHIKDANLKRFEYLSGIITHHGAEKLKETPRIIIGTIHSVKGGQADVVYLSPDLSPMAYERLQDGYEDEIIRQYYVGITRAFETLVICEPSGNAYVDI